MHVGQDEVQSYIRCVQLYKALDRSGLNVKILEEIFKKDGDINFKIPIVSFLKFTQPPFTPRTILYIAYANNNLEAFKLLLDVGADFTIKDNDSMTVIHSILEKSLEESKPMPSLRKDKYIEAILSAHIKYQKLENPCDNNGVSHFHVACMTNNVDAIEFFLQNKVPIDCAVKVDSPYFPGYMPIHFAVESLSLEAVEVLLEYGADISVKNARGMALLHILVEEKIKVYRKNFLYIEKNQLDKYSIRQIEVIDYLMNLLLKRYSDDNPVYTDDLNMSYFHFVCTMQDSSLVQTLVEEGTDMNISVNVNSHVWPGYTALHFAAHCNVNTVKLLVEKGLDIEAKDAKGVTPFDICIESWNFKDVNSIVMLKQVWQDILLTDGKTKLSDLIMIMQNPTEFGNLLRKHSHISIPPESPLLPGFTLFDLVTSFPIRLAANQLKNIPAIKEYFNFDAQSAQTEITSLDLALKAKSEDLLLFLTKNNIDILAEDTKGLTPLSVILEDFWINDNLVDLIISKLYSDEELQKRMLQKFGITMLHFACYVLDIDRIKILVETGANVNAKIIEDSQVWPGDTPLHVLLKKIYVEGCSNKANKDALILLLNNGADVCLMDSQQNTPVHMSIKSWITDRDYIDLLLQYHCDFSVNPVNRDGISHFHAACMVNNVTAVEKFLRAGIDVNKTIEFFPSSNSKLAGYGPLHLSLDPPMKKNFDVASQLKVVTLLCEHGADAKAENSFGRTPLHLAAYYIAEPTYLPIFSVLLKYGADINHENIFGLTPLECLLSRRKEIPISTIKFLKKNGCRVFACDRFSETGYIATILSNGCSDENALIEEILKDPDLTEVDNMGRTALHKAVAGSCRYDNSRIRDYFQLISHLNCDIDGQDNAGRTVLHLAIKFGNTAAVEALLMIGADVNIRDASGTSIFSYALKYTPKKKTPYLEPVSVIDILADYTRELQICALDLISIDEKFAKSVYYEVLFENFRERVEETKKIVIEPLSLSLFDFLSETKAVVAYSTMQQLDRNKIDEFFKSNIQNINLWVKGILNLQYRKAVARRQLVERAKVCLMTITPLPDLCVEYILKFLSHWNLKYLIEAVNLDS